MKKVKLPKWLYTIFGVIARTWRDIWFEECYPDYMPDGGNWKTWYEFRKQRLFNVVMIIIALLIVLYVL